MFGWLQRIAQATLLLGFLLGHLAANDAQADQQKIVLLTSLDTRAAQTLLRKNYYRTYVPRLETLFIQSFENSRYIIEVVNQADQFHLWNALHDPRNVAVFWLSHASFSGRDRTGSELLTTHRILDYHGYDITPIFEKIHPNLRFLAVIGCFSKKILNSLSRTSQDPKHPEHPYLRLFTFNNRVNAQVGLRQAIEESKRVLEIPEIRLGFSSPCLKVPGYRIQVSRQFDPAKLDSIRPSARIMAGAEPLDVFPASQSNDSLAVHSQTHDIFLPKRRPDLPSIRVNVGENFLIQRSRALTSQVDLGFLEILLQGQLQTSAPWDLWKTPDGRPIGVFAHSYKPRPILTQNLDLNAFATEDYEFRCEAMPSYD